MSAPQAPEQDPELGLDDCCCGEDESEERQPLLAQGCPPSYTTGEASSKDEVVVDKGGTDIVQFSAPMFYADESETHMKVDVMRLGSMKDRVAVTYETYKGSAKADINYSYTKGQLIFEEGEHTKSIDIPILHDSSWSPVLDFKVHLFTPVNCHLGLYLHHCRVKIINSDPFPSELYAEEIAKGSASIRNIDSWSLFFEYCRTSYEADSIGIKYSTLLVLIFDQLSNLFLFGTLWFGVYLVDTVFAPRGKGSSKDLLVPDRYHTAVIVALWYVLPNIVLYAWDSIKVHIDIKGSLRKFMQLSMMQQYMSYSPESKQQVSAFDVDSAIGQSADQAAASYTALISIFGLAGRIVVIELFIVIFQPERLAIFSVFLMVVILVLFTALRVGYTQQAQDDVDTKAEFLATLTDEASLKYQLIADYNRRSWVSDQFSKGVTEHTQQKIPETMLKLGTLWTTRFVTGLFIAMYIIAKTPEVLSDHLSLGIFLATITIFGTYLADTITELNAQLMIIVEGFKPIKDFTVYFNLPLELPALKKINRLRRQATSEARQGVLSPQGSSRQIEGESSYKSDSIPLRLVDISFAYPGGDPVLKDVNIAAPQGSMVAVVGEHRAGKSTLMSLLANMLVPTAGMVFVPSHLRVLHVSREPMFLQASLLNNLALGLPVHKDKQLERIYDILKILGLEDEVASIAASQTLEDGTPRSEPAANEFDPNEAGWESVLSHSHQLKLHLARALIANPEVMILEGPLQGLDEESSNALLDLLRRHVTERGLCLPEEGRAKRRPRNVFFVAEDGREALQADIVWQVDKEKKVVVDITRDVRNRRMSIPFVHRDRDIT